jgi:uncharacterized damage-inducible protein DinB
MPTSLVERYRRWFAYECDAHAKVLASLESVPAGGRATTEYRRAVSIMAHIVMARRIWLERLGIVPCTSNSLFPQDVDALHTAWEWQEVRHLWTEYLAALDDEGLARVVEYQSLDAGRFRNRVEDILDQLFGHSWYHRGQIAMLVRVAGGQPAATDLIYWCREPMT